MKLTPLIFLFPLIIFGCQTKIKQPANAPPKFKNLSENLDQYFEKLKDLKKFNGGVLVQKQAEQILYKVYQMEENQKSLNITKGSQFDIHSISKLMGQAAVVNLERDLLISRGDKVSKFIPGFPKGELITIQHLIDNQSGLPRGFSKDYPDLIDIKPDELVELIKQETFLFEPGAEILYSNLGYQLLYFIISKVTDKPFVQYLDEAFFQPLEMKNTGAHFHLPKNNKNLLVKNHELDDDKIIVVPNIQRNGKNQAKIYSTMDDLLKFINFVNEEPYKTAMKSQNNEIGWSGGGDGILSHAKASLKSDYEVVFFSNYDEIPFGDILETVEKIMKKEPYDLPEKIDRKVVQIDKNILKKYVGKYRVKEFNNNIFEFRIEKDKLVFYQNGEKNTILNAESNTTFFDEPDAEDYFEFRPLKKEAYTMIFHHKKIEFKGEKIVN